MKRLMPLLLACAVLVGLAGCAGQHSPESLAADKGTVSVQSLNAEKRPVAVEVPFDPQRVAVLDMASLDIIDALGMGDRVVGSATTDIHYLAEDYSPDKNAKIANLGTIKAADLVEVAASQPDVIFIGGRLASSYDDLSKIAPVVYLATDAEKGVLESTRANALTVGTIFGKEAEAEALMEGFEGRIEAVRSELGGARTVVGMYSGSSLNVLGNDGRCSLIGREMGLENLGAAGAVTSTHGNEASWETIATLDPEWLVVLDRNAATESTAGNPAVRDAVENSLVKELDVHREDKIVYLANPDVWYTAEGGVQALDVMISDVEQGLLGR